MSPTPVLLRRPRSEYTPARRLVSPRAWTREPGTSSSSGAGQRRPVRGACRARARRARAGAREGRPREWSGGNSAFTAGAIRLAHGGLEDLRDARRGRRRRAGRPRPTSTPYPAEDVPRRPAPGDARPRRPGDGADPRRGLAARRSRWLRERGLRFRLMYERQAYDVGRSPPLLGRARARHRRRRRGADGPAPRRGRARPGSSCATTRRSRTSCATRRARSAGWSSAPGRRGATLARGRRRARGGRLRGQPAAARRLSRARTGTWPRSAARRTTPARCCDAALAHGAQPYGHWSGCHAIQWDAGAPPTGDLELTNRYSRQSYPLGIVVNARGERFLDEGADFRNYTYARYGAEVLRQPGGVAAQVFDASTIGQISGDRLRGARRRARRRRHARPSSPRASASTPSASSAPSREFNAAVRPGAVRPRRSRTASAPRASTRRSPTGRCRSRRRRSPPSASPAASPSRSAACGWTSTHRCSTTAGARCPACTRPASWSAGSSSTTTPAAAG